MGVKMTQEVDSCSSATSKHDVNSMKHRKRKLFSEEECSETASSCHTPDPPGVKFKMEEFGSVTKELEALHARRLRLLRILNGEAEAPPSQRLQFLSPEQIQDLRLKLSNRSTVESELDVEKTRNGEHFKSVNQKDTNFPQCGVIKLEDDSPISKVMAIDTPVIILDSDDEDNGYKAHTEVETSEIKVESNDKECIDQIHGHIGEIDDEDGVIHDSPDKDLGHEMHSHNYGKVVAIDTPVVILDSDDEDSGYKTHTEVETSGIKVESNDKDCIDQIHGLIGEIDDEDGVIHDSTDKDLGHEMHSHNYQKVVDESSIQLPVTGGILSLSANSNGPRGEFSSSGLPHACMEVITDKYVQENMFEKEKTPKDEVGYLPVTCDTGRGKSAYASTENDVVMNEDEQLITSDDGLADIWKDMAFALESCKGLAAVPSIGEHMEENEEDCCDHSFVLKDDIGYVCRICGVIDRSIDTIFEYLYPKGRRSTRTYAYDSENRKGKESTDVNPAGDKYTEDGLMATEMFAHPRHSREMKAHQVEGFKFLCSNLLCDDPGGCILAHAPGSGKTFVIISFLQGFLAKFPSARPLVILPKGILATWKKEFQTWQVEDIPLLDFVSSKAKSRPQQLDVLKKWEKQRSVLFLGYQQFSAIVCDAKKSKAAAECKDILLKVPTLVILDEGHTPRNEETDVVQSLARIQTPLKVVLSGTLYQNHVIEVFNVLNLVRPGFLRLDNSRTIVKRILSKVIISGMKKQFRENSDTAFYELVEHTIQRDDDFKRKVSVIQDLREMTSRVLHYYKGDFLDELPELTDLTVFLNLSSRQKDEVKKIKNLDRFKQVSLGSSVYMHPKLKDISQKNQASGDKGSDEKMDAMLQELDVREGVKMKFVFHIMGLCESSEEKLIVFSQYIVPLKLLERMAVKYKGWRPGKELFTITGDTSAENRERCVEQFNGSADAKVFFGSIKACGEGISLVGASRVIILDVHLNPSVTRQAIGRAYRRPQNKKVFVYRLVAADSPEEEDYLTCSRKELISKMWFEWNEYCGNHDFDAKTVGVNECGDRFLESPMLKDDIKVLYQR